MNVSEIQAIDEGGASAAVLLAVGLFAAPETAWAGCSHAVSSQSDRQSNLAPARRPDLERGIIGSAQRKRAIATPGSPARTPCSGPSCSNSPLPLPISTVSGNPENRDRWGTLGAAIVVDNTSFHDRTVDEPSPAAAGEKSSIFHPPRV